MEDYYEYLDSNGVTTLYKLIKDDTVALIDSYSVTINGITTNLDNHVNNADIHTPIATIEGMIDTKVAGLVNSAPETLDTLKELSDALGNDPNFATTVANQIGSKASKDDVYTKLETDTLLEGKANSVHSHVVSDITDFPIIPTKTSQLINDSGFLTSSNGLITSVSWSDITDKPNFSTVATSGSYTDLSNTPTIPTKVSQLENDMGFGTGGDTSDCVHKTGDENISGTKMFSNTIHRYADLTTSGGEQVYAFSDTNANACGHIFNNVHWGGDCIYNRHGAHNNKSGKTMEIIMASNDAGFGMVSVEGTATKGNLETATSATDHTAIATMGWVNNPATSTNVVHRSGDEYIHGTKIFSGVIHRYTDLTTSGGAQVYRFDDTNANACGHIYNNVHWHDNAVFNRHGAYNAKSGKTTEIDITTNDAGVGMIYVAGTSTKGNLETVTSATGHTGIATMGWVNNPATSTNVVHRSGDETINGTKTFTETIWKKNSALDLQVNPSSAQYNSFIFSDKNNVVMAYLEHVQTTTGVNALGLIARDKNNGSRGIQVTSENNVIPLGDGVVNLGLSGSKWKNVYSNRVSFPSEYYITTDTNDNSLRIIRDGTGHGNNYKVIIQGDTGKFFAPNGFIGNLQGNADSSTKASYLDNYSVPGMNKIYLDWSKQVNGYVGLKVDNTTMGGILTTKSITFVKGTNYWYRKHSDGFIEMGGFTNCANTIGSAATTNMPLAFSNTNYTLLVQLTRGTEGGDRWGNDYSLPFTQRKMTTGFIVYSDHLSETGNKGGGYDWYACGY